MWLVLPGVLAVLPLLIYAASPAYYKAHVLNEQYREYQPVEMVTLASAVLGGVALLAAGLVLLKKRYHAAAGVAAVSGLASLFLAGEEVNWGQTFANWGVPEREQELTAPLNLHNTTEMVSIQSLGSIFIIGLFLVLPLAFALRTKTRLPGAWRPAVPPLPAVVSVLLGFLFSDVKDFYRKLYEPDASDRLYMDFLEQANELKEMLIAVGLLLYGVSALGRGLRRKHASQPSDAADGPA